MAIPLAPIAASQLEIPLPGPDRVLPAPLSQVHGAGAVAAGLEDGMVTPCPCLQVSREESPSDTWTCCRGPSLLLFAVPKDLKQICMWGLVQGTYHDLPGPDRLLLTSGLTLTVCVKNPFLVRACVHVCVCVCDSSWERENSQSVLVPTYLSLDPVFFYHYCSKQQ